MRDTIHFLLGFERRALRGVDPTLTVLNYLRTVERRCGTKEGCAEGDCGACTVVLGEAVDGHMRYRAVNACILLLPALDGRQLLTVEDLKSGAGLHPVQQAMVDCHGSQCGFCTPGFVMSLFALYQGESPPQRRRIDSVLAGNLCRCTGYRPIVDAARRMYELPADTRFAAREAQTMEALTQMRGEPPLALTFAERRFFAPRTVEHLADLLAGHPRAVLLAGGTDVGVWVSKQHRALDTVIHIGGIAALNYVSRGDDVLEIGAATPYSDCVAALGQAYPDFGTVLERLGCVQIRNTGTLGGNIGNASPIGDTMPLLIALGASAMVRSRAGRREVPLEAFFRGYRETALEAGEFIECVRVPLPVADLDFRAYKVSKRIDQDISAVCAAFALRLEGGRVRDIRIGLGGVAATPVRARRTEAALRGRPWNEATVAAAAAVLRSEFSPLSDWRASADYRRAVLGNLLRKCYVESAQAGVPTRVAAEEAAP